MIVIDQIVPQQLAGWQLEGEPEVYDRQTIFDYINGAGEVYLSYGFKNVLVFHYSRENAPFIQVEIFDMGKTEDAYGVFSHARETEEAGIGGSYEYRGSLLCFWQNRYYVCILAEQNTLEAKNAVFELGRKISSELPAAGEKPTVIDYLPDANLDASSARYFHIHSILNYHYFLSEENLLNLSPETEGVLGVYGPGESYLICIKYPSDNLAATGYRQFREGYLPEADESGSVMLENGTWVAAKQEGQFVIVVLDMPDEGRADELAEACLEKIRSTVP